MCYNIGMLAYTDICLNIERFETTCARYGATLTLATKTIPREVLTEVHRDFPSIIFGENRVQELVEKYFAEAKWHFIGRLQRNKVKYLVDKVEMICSVDSVPLAIEIERQAAKIGKTMDVLIEINLGEVQKGGVGEAEQDALVTTILGCPHLHLKGLMAVLPQVGAEAAAKQAKRRYDALAQKVPVEVLSMGMSGDYELSLAAGSTMIRLGSAVFGKRS